MGDDATEADLIFEKFFDLSEKYGVAADRSLVATVVHSEICRPSSKLYEISIDKESANAYRIGPRFRLNQNRIREQSMDIDEYEVQDAIKSIPALSVSSVFHGN